MSKENEEKRMCATRQAPDDLARKYLDIAGVILVAIGKDRRVTMINKKGCEVLGCSEDEIVGRDWFANFLPERMREEVGLVFRRLVAGEIDPVEYFENPVLTRTGEERIIAWHNTVLRDEHGNITGTLSSGEDITERRLAEQRLLEIERHKSQFYRQTILAATDGKLIVCEPEEVAELDQHVAEDYALREPEDVGAMRHQMRDAAVACGMPEPRAGDFALCVGEAATNALKHAGGGEVTLIFRGEQIMARVSDHGPGMDALTLPRVTLELGYSTGKSLGMGYAVILSLADQVLLCTGPAGTTVVIEMDLKARAPVRSVEALPDTW